MPNSKTIEESNIFVSKRKKNVVKPPLPIARVVALLDSDDPKFGGYERCKHYILEITKFSSNGVKSHTVYSTKGVFKNTNIEQYKLASFKCLGTSLFLDEPNPKYHNKLIERVIRRYGFDAHDFKIYNPYN